MKTPVALLTGLAATTVALGSIAASPAGAAAPACGFGDPMKDADGKTFYLTSITARKGISCYMAKRAAKNVSDKKLCGASARHNGWKVRHVGNEYAIHGRFTRGKQSFDVQSQGSC